MNTAVSTLWNKLWEMHYKAKDTLLFFAKTNTSDAKNLNDSNSLNDNPHNQKPEKMTARQKVGLILGPALFILFYFFIEPAGMSEQAIAVLASTLWVATWWITEAIPIPATSLLPIILFPLTGAIEGNITSSYADNNIFLFMGGFIIAVAMEKWNLHRRIALNIILAVGTNTNRLILGFMVATGFLSLWISNSATAMMMMPIGLAVIHHVNESINDHSQRNNFAKTLMLGIAYSASIGGLGTLIGTPPNTIFASFVKEFYGIEISFATWMAFGLPLATILLIIAWVYLVKAGFPLKLKELPGGREVIQSQKRDLGAMSFEEKLVFIVFILTAFAWISRTFILKFIPDDTVIAIMAAVLLFLLPAKRGKSGRILNWEDAVKIPWGILLLFGGGLAIAKGFSDSGLAKWIGEQLTVLQGVHFMILVTLVTALVIFLTEITSNTATATMMYPIMASLALSLEVHPYALLVAAGLSASCAFMLPVATPPNAVVFGSGYITINDMVKAGFWLNILCIIAITLMIYFIMPTVWGIDLNIFPDNMRQ